MIFHMFLGKAVKLFISTGIVTTLVFPYSIEQIIGGWNKTEVYKYLSKDRKTLVMKSLIEKLDTNLTVITSGGGVYQFEISTKHKPHSFVEIVNGVGDFSFKLEKESSKYSLLTSKSTVQVINKSSKAISVNGKSVIDKVVLPKGSPVFINGKRELF
jgi:type IV secretory pathway VirB9-like protein